METKAQNILGNELVLKDIDPNVELAQEQSFQARAKNAGTGGIGISVMWWMARAGLSLSPWWSPARDRQLREFWKEVDYLAGAVYSMEAKMTAIPFTIQPSDQSDEKQVAQADEFFSRIFYSAEYGDGWPAFYGKWVEDLLTADNGAFAEIVGPGDPSGPLVGMPATIAHLDSFRSQRTGDSTFPVIYLDQDGRRHKIHYTRVIFASQMSSPVVDMCGVGFCSISRCSNVAQTMLDILIYKQEKLGSRPHRQMLVTQGGLDPDDVVSSFRMAELNMNSQNLSRYSKMVVVGSRNLMEANIVPVDLASLPDGFNEEQNIIYGMATIALAFGVDARELFPAMSAGATRADALLQHLKQRGKGPGQIIQVTESAFNYKFLPPTLKMVFDFQDDAQDRQVADIKQVRSNYRNIDILNGSVSPRVAHEQMLKDGDIDRAQFEKLELDDGRLQDGTPILALFYSNNSDFRSALKIEGTEDPLDVKKNKAEIILEQITMRRKEAYMATINNKNASNKSFWRKVLAALAKLEELYTPVIAEPGVAGQKGATGLDKRVRTQDLTTVNPNDTSTDPTTQSHDGQDTENQG